jgi:hypothetical protein
VKFFNFVVTVIFSEAVCGELVVFGELVDDGAQAAYATAHNLIIIFFKFVFNK